MAEYIAIHKCRLCGKLFEGAHGGEQIARKEMINLVVTRKSELIQSPQMMDIHDCSNGSYGMADFQGFKKVGD